MMNKSKSKKELDIDFIGGEELTDQEELELKKYFSKQKASKKRYNSIKKSKEQIK